MIPSDIEEESTAELPEEESSCADHSLIIPELSPSQIGFINRKVPTALGTGGKLTLVPVADHPDSLEVRWKVSLPNPNDNIRLYIHDRFHDKNYLSYVYTDGKEEGSHIFPGLFKGFYDVRFFRGTSTTHADDVVVAICCLGECVPLDVNIGSAPARLLTVRVESRYVEGPNDWLALFPDGQHSNRAHRCSASALASEATCAAGVSCVTFNLQMPKTPGKYELRYFFGSSQSKYYGNAFSGRAPVVIPCEDVLKATYDTIKKRCTITWKIYSVDPNDWQWIGLYDSNGNRITYEYTCKHIYTTKNKNEGVVVLTDVPQALLDWSKTGVMPSEVRSWYLCFYNSYFSENLAVPVIKQPFI